MTISPYLFSTDLRLVQALAGADAAPDRRVGAVVVDWERRGKAERQQHALAQIGTDTQIGVDTVDDLGAVAEISAVPVVCRLNAWGPGTPGEMERAIAGGAVTVLLPMVRTAAEVAAALDVAAGRIGIGILVETRAAVSIADELSELPLAMVYVGLMDLAIDSGSSTIFAPLVNGIVERLRASFSVPFGVGGLTVPLGGHPIPAPILAGELIRLGCDFSFLRRAFIRHAVDDPSAALVDVLAMLDALERRTPSETAADRRSFLAAVRVAAGVAG